MTKTVDLGHAEARLEAFERVYCPACGEECPEDADWCNYFGEGRVPITPIRVRWTAEILEP